MRYDLQSAICLVIINTLQAVSGNPCFFWNGAQYFDSFCYKLSDTTASWATAKATCESSSGHLANPATGDSLEFLTDLFYTTYTEEADWWLGTVWNNIDSVWTPGNTIAPTSSSDGYCVKIAARNKTLELPHLANASCSALNKFICERYVNDPCRYALPGGEFYDGSCFRFNTTKQLWNNSLATCAKDGALFAELPLQDLYSFAKALLLKSIEFHFKSAADQLVDMGDRGVTLNCRKSFGFYVSTCSGFHVYLCGAVSGGSQGTGTDSSPCRGSDGEYLDIGFLTNNQTELSVKKCQQNGTCETLNLSTRPNTADCYFIRQVIISCSPNFSVSIEVSSGSTIQWVSSSLNVTIARLTVRAAAGPAVWYFGNLNSFTYIFLGAINETTWFRWMYSKQNMTLADWWYGEPNSMGAEKHLSWGVSYASVRYIKLNDINGNSGPAWSLCQKSSYNVSYFIILPEKTGSIYQSGDLAITTGERGAVYLHFTQILNTGEVTQYQNWTSLDRSCLFHVHQSIQLSTTAITRGILIINASQEVTVVLYYAAGSDVSSTLIFPSDFLGATYFILTYSSSSFSSSLITMTALDNDTIVTIKLPASLSMDNIVTIGYTYGTNIINICLNKLESTQMETRRGDISGTFVSSNKPIAILTGSKSIDTGGIFALDAALPVETLTWTYLVYCDVPDNIKVLALLDGTIITVTGLGSPMWSPISFTLNSGQVREETILTAALYVVESDISHPFYVIKISYRNQAVCVTSLLPYTSERQAYDLLIQQSGQTAYVIGDARPDNFNCNSYSYKGLAIASCTNTYMTPGNYHVQTMKGTGVKAAYTQSSDGEFCHPLGAKRSTSDRVTVNALSYLGVSISPDDSCTPTTTTVTTTTAVATTDSAQTTNIHSDITTASFQVTNATSNNTTASDQITGISINYTTASNQITGISVNTTTASGQATGVSNELTTASGQATGLSNDLTTASGQATNVASNSTTASGQTTNIPINSTTALGQATYVTSDEAKASDRTTNISSVIKTVSEETSTPSIAPLQNTITATTPSTSSLDAPTLSSPMPSQSNEIVASSLNWLNTTTMSFQQPDYTSLAYASISQFQSSQIILPELMSSIIIVSDPPEVSRQEMTSNLFGGSSGPRSGSLDTSVIQATSVGTLNTQSSHGSNIQHNVNLITPSTDPIISMVTFTASEFPVSISYEISNTQNLALDLSAVSNIQHPQSLTATSHLSSQSFSTVFTSDINQPLAVTNSSVSPIEETTAATQSRPDQVCVLCPCRYVHTKNMSSFQVFLDKVSRSIREELTVNGRDVSALKRTKISVWDERLSSHVIGGSGVVILIGWIAILMSSDILRVVRFFCSLRKTPTINSVNS